MRNLRWRRRLGTALAWLLLSKNDELPPVTPRSRLLATNKPPRNRQYANKVRHSRRACREIAPKLRRYLYTVGLVHVAAGLPSPSKDPDWPVKWKKLIRLLKTTGGHARKQAGELDMAGIETILATLGDSPRDLRDAALLAIASDTLCRESELVAIRVEDLHHNRRRNTWSLHVPFSKTNQDGAAPDYRFVSLETMARVRAWQAAANISEGPLFRATGGRPKAGGESGALLPQEVARIFRRRAKAAGLEHAGTISGHSTRIGSANDLSEHGATGVQIQQAGGWKTDRMVTYYTRRSQAGANAMAGLRARHRVAPDQDETSA